MKLEWWPKWDPKGTGNNTYIEPDVFIRFREFDLIIEAKRWDSPMQNSEQWKAELKAYINEYGARKRQVIMIALGGIQPDRDKSLRDVWRSDTPGVADEHEFICPVHMCQWSSVLLACQRRKRELAEGERSSRSLADLRILNDLTELFIRHGFAPLRWFPDFQFRPNPLSDSAAAEQQSFRNASLRFRAA